ncbi:MAG TPA: hypothetical protein VMS12_11415 [Thermoanaerobaculia bacterium]|nr:hypothetical protein [Thermoanaerobaculia bacterium]
MERWQELFAETVFHRSADTAHDLKTPLNIGVLNLELLRMRLRKLDASSEGDSRIETHAAAIDTELRRLATIFDVFFVYSVPPRGDEELERLDVAEALMEAGTREGAVLEPGIAAMVLAHPSRIEMLSSLFFEGASRLVELSMARISYSVADGRMMLRIEGALRSKNAELAKVFKFYYTDPSGAPDLCLATSRLIAETYGGEITAEQENEIAVIELILPIEER